MKPVSIMSSLCFCRSLFVLFPLLYPSVGVMAKSNGEDNRQLHNNTVYSMYKPGDTIKDCSDCPELVVVPPGSFIMGSPPAEARRGYGEGPQRQVVINYYFAMGRTHITKKQFAAFVTDTNYVSQGGCLSFGGGGGLWKKRSWQNPGFPQDDNHPVTCVSWLDAKAYASWLTRKTGKQYRLPSEAEWEYAAKAGTVISRYWGENADLACNFANVADISARNKVADISWDTHNCNDGYAYTSPVGIFKPNNFGLYDMLGNLWQWVEDSAHDNYEGAPTDGGVWQGKSTRRMLRGGSWSCKTSLVRSSSRLRLEESTKDQWSGFRVIRILNRQ